MTLSYSKLSEFKENLRSMKAFFFLINNLEYIRQFAHELNLTEALEKASPGFEAGLQSKLSLSADRACDIFRFLSRKWQNIGEVICLLLNIQASAIKRLINFNQIDFDNYIIVIVIGRFFIDLKEKIIIKAQEDLKEDS